MKKFKITPLKIEIRPSTMLPKEIGLFAVRSLKKDSVIAEASKLGEVFVPWGEVKKVDKITKRKLDQYCLQTDEGLYAPSDLNFLSVPWNMNHSCSYNVGFDSKGNFVAAKNIKAGGELFWDYGMGQSHSKFKMVCKCGSANCRKVITGDDWKNKKFREKNKRYFLRELLEKAKNIKLC